MNSEKLTELIGKIDDDLVCKAMNDMPTNNLIHLKIKRFIPIVAALICVLAAGIALLPMLWKDNPLLPPIIQDTKTETSTEEKTEAITDIHSDTSASEEITEAITDIESGTSSAEESTTEIKTPPEIHDAYLSADEVAELFDINIEGVATSSYTKLYWQESRPLPIGALPKEEYAYIYRTNAVSKELSRQELEKFADGITQRLTQSLQSDIDSFTRQESDDDNGLSLRYEGDSDLGFRFYQSEKINSASVYSRYSPFIFDGQKLCIDQRLGEVEILSSLEAVRDKLFAIFDCSFDSADIIFYYDSYSQYGAQHVAVLYFNKSELPARGDYIAIEFDNFQNFSGDIVSADILEKCSISYVSRRTPTEPEYTAEAACRLISLADAEELLSKGYVFGGHACPLCMAEQEKISFDGYDYVGYEYVNGYKTSLSVPFYTFYKKLGTSQNGNTIYAKTYVCAIEVTGLEEYFDAQKSTHKGSESDTVTEVETATEVETMSMVEIFTEIESQTNFP